MHKNMVLTLSIVWFSYFTGQSGTSPYESTIYGLFNFALGWPIVWLGVMDQDLSEEYMLKNPKTYITGLSNSCLEPVYLASWIANAMMYAVVICVVCYHVLPPSLMEWDSFSVGLFVYYALVMSLQVKVSFMYHQWNYIILFFMVLSVGGQIAVTFVLSNMPLNTLPPESDGFYKVAEFISNEPIYWVVSMMTIPFLCMFVELVQHSFKLFFMPTREMPFREEDRAWEFSYDELYLDRFLRQPILKLAAAMGLKIGKTTAVAEPDPNGKKVIPMTIMTTALPLPSKPQAAIVGSPKDGRVAPAKDPLLLEP